jgi:hypothetical protein
VYTLIVKKIIVSKIMEGTNMSFDNFVGLDVNQVKRDLSFSVNLESVLTEQDDRISKNAVTRFTPEGKKILGLVSPKRKIIPYSEMMDWVVGEMDNLGVNYKLKESTLVSKSDNLFQQYLFDSPITNPDGLDISPMVILKGSHVSVPLKIDIGTYRFVCSNGALVGNTIKSISLKANDLDGLMRRSLRDEISAGIDSMTRISARYQELASENMMEYMMKIFNSPFVPVALKKSMMDFWAGDGTIVPLTQRTIKNNDFLAFKLDSDAILDLEGNPVLEVVNEKSAWNLYNDTTDVATHTSRNELTRNHFYNVISTVFAA